MMSPRGLLHPSIDRPAAALDDFRAQGRYGGAPTEARSEPSPGGKRRVIAVAGAVAALSLVPSAASAEEILSALLSGTDSATTARLVETAATLTVLAVLPGLLMVVTSFTRFVIVLSFLRTGLGLQSTPSNLILINLALFMTLFVMAPTFDRAWQEGARPLMEKRITHAEAADRIVRPFKHFMQSQVREDDLRIFHAIAERRGGARISPAAAAEDLRILVPAFVISELRRGFEIGFMIVLPFLVIDLVTAVVVTSMGMMMMPPTTFSLPLKVLFFVVIDGWAMLVGALIKSFG